MPTKTQLLDEIESLKKTLRASLAVSETDNTFYVGTSLSGLYRDRFEYDRQTIFAECLRAWRVNPIARRIVKLTTQFVIGKEAIQLEVRHKATQKFVDEWTAHPLNFLDRTTQKEWADEMFRTGNLFHLYTTVDRMPFVRATPADLIEDIQVEGNDYKQETHYIPVDKNAPPWIAWSPDWQPDEKNTTAMTHYAVNRPVGVPWGEPDLAPLLDWIGHYSSWLRDRARLNRFRNAFNYVVIGDYKNEEARKLRQAELNANPPQPGSILVVNKNDEAWGTLSPQLDSFDSGQDGLALKKMISAGIGYPLHWLAEPEGETRTTAEAAGTPTFRGLEDIQSDFYTCHVRLARIAAHIARAQGWARLDPAAKIIPHGPDITERDNSVLALAVGRIYPVMADLFDRKGIDENELLRVIYRMAGEVYEKGESQVHMIRRPVNQPGNPPAPEPDQPGDDGPPEVEEPK